MIDRSLIILKLSKKKVQYKNYSNISLKLSKFNIIFIYWKYQYLSWYLFIRDIDIYYDIYLLQILVENHFISFYISLIKLIFKRISIP